MSEEEIQSAKSGRAPIVRYTCFTCRNPIGHKDLVSIKGNGSLFETYHCTSCSRILLKKAHFEEVVEKETVLKWIGKTWSFEMPLYKKDVWDDLQRGLKDGTLFPEDSLISERARALEAEE